MITRLFRGLSMNIFINLNSISLKAACRNIYLFSKCFICNYRFTLIRFCKNKSSFLHSINTLFVLKRRWDAVTRSRDFFCRWSVRLWVCLVTWFRKFNNKLNSNDKIAFCELMLWNKSLHQRINQELEYLLVLLFFDHLV